MVTPVGLVRRFPLLPSYLLFSRLRLDAGLRFCWPMALASSCSDKPIYFLHFYPVPLFPSSHTSAVKVPRYTHPVVPRILHSRRPSDFKTLSRIRLVPLLQFKTPTTNSSFNIPHVSDMKGACQRQT